MNFLLKTDEDESEMQNKEQHLESLGIQTDSELNKVIPKKILLEYLKQ